MPEAVKYRKHKHIYSEVPTSAGTWDYRVRITSGSCPAVYSPSEQIVVNLLRWVVHLSEEQLPFV